MTNCIFCKIASGEIPSHKIYEDDNFLAFLDAFPFARGQSLVIPKVHLAPFLFDMDDEIYNKMLLVVKKVAMATNKYIRPLKTGILVEGLEVEHVHVKIFPLNDKGFRIVCDEQLKFSDDEMEKIALGIKSCL